MYNTNKENDLLSKVLAQHLNAFERDLFNANRHLSRHLCQRNKTFFVLALDDKSEPYMVEELSVEGVSADLSAGLRIFLKGSQSEYEITSTPQRLSNSDIFAWVPYYDMCEYTPKGESHQHNLRISMCIKQPHSPRLPKIEVPFVADYATAVELFPQFR